MPKHLPLISFATLAIMVLTSGIFRHDVDEQEYLSLAREKQFNCVGQVFYDTSGIGSCVLISRKYVLSAAHVFMENDYRQDTMLINGNKVIANNPVNFRVMDPQKVRILLNGHYFNVNKITLHPNYLDEGYLGIRIFGEPYTRGTGYTCNPVPQITVFGSPDIRFYG